MRKLINLIIMSVVFFATNGILGVRVASGAGNTIYLPLVINSKINGPLVNVPYLPVSDVFASQLSVMAIFWYGKVRPDTNYTDVRIGYNDQGLWVHANIIDRRLWYNASSKGIDLESWDSVTLLIDQNTSSPAQAPQYQSYRFVSELHTIEASQNYRASYQGDGSQWVKKSIPFTDITTWRGEPQGPNQNIDNKGWTASFMIPFTSLGLSGKPSDGTTWRLALQTHDRDYLDATALPDQLWPDENDAKKPSTWAWLRFGLPSFSPPSVTNKQTTTIINHVNGIMAPDVAAGGGSTCGYGLDYWTQWGEKNYAGDEFFNVQNQEDVSEYPCFSKYYVNFPLNTIPAGKVISSAKLILREFGGSDPSNAYGSMIQLSLLGQDWNEATLNWNNAPEGMENVAQTWVDVFPAGGSTWPGIPYTWDVSKAVTQAYKEGTPLRLVAYSASRGQHSGKYFYSSDSGVIENTPANAQVRPALVIEWGDGN